MSSDFSSLMDLSRVVDFSVCSDLYLLGGGVSSKVFYMSDQIPKVLKQFFKDKIYIP